MDSVATTQELNVLDNFLRWCEKHKIRINPKVRVTNINTSHRYGIMASEDISCSETLVEIPRNIALTPSQSTIASRLQEFKESNADRLKQTSGWISLLLALMYEMKKGDSYWGPYLTVCPSIKEFNQPMFWSEDERQEELAGLSVLWDVQRDLFNIEREYQQFAIPFIEKNSDIMSKEVHDLPLYKHMVGFVMSYSFTDYQSNKTLMVPVADIFNHHTNNNAQLSFDYEKSLKMISTKPIQKGEEIFNTFGKLGNSHLLHMYGFVEMLQNPYDTVEIPLTHVVDALEATDTDKLPLLQAMLAFMRKMGIADEKDPFVFNTCGLKTGPDMYAVLRILHMDLREFTGLLQDHISWYQDGYFICLLDHVRQAMTKWYNNDDWKRERNGESDDEIMIVKEVKGNARNEVETKKNGNSTDVTNNIEAKNTNEVNELKIDNDDNKASISVIRTCSKQGKEEFERNNTIVKRQNAGQGSAEAASKDVPENTPQESKKSTQQSSNSDGSKSKNRKRKPMKEVNERDDSDDVKNVKSCKVPKNENDKQIPELENETKNETIKETRNETKTETRPEIKNEISTTEKKAVSWNPSFSRKGSVEETAKWVLQLPNVDGEHSDDHEDESDDNDSETQLQLTYDQINSILPPSWKITMRSVVAKALLQVKTDQPQTDRSKFSEHAALGYQVRSGQKRILLLLDKSLAS